MIISASRRTDIPAFYVDWFFHRLQEGFVYVKNPMNPRQISRISLDPEVLDGIVFWTKNPGPMMERLEELGNIPFYVQFTLNSYGTDVEPGVPNKGTVMVPTFQKLSSEIGRERVIWRYDPILLNEKYTADYHVRYFTRIADRLADATEVCTISFLDLYKNIQKPIRPLNIHLPSVEEMTDLAGRLSQIAREHGLVMQSCAEEIDLEAVGIRRGSCIDKTLLERIGGYRLEAKPDKNQRPACGCAESVDIGTYGCCRHGCLYCYARRDQGQGVYDPASPVLCGKVEEGDRITERKMPVFRRDAMEWI
ncbi:MAG: DUF1848 domain-containing protein [Clostridia bacterium]|nr:DUF1848 domain-containing protein [Clostridia bacterium]